MFCSNCGNQIPDGARFCQSCGNPVSAAGAPQPTGAPQPMQQAPPPTGAPRPMQQAVQPTGAPQPMQQPTQPAGSTHPLPHAGGRPTAPLPVDPPVKCPACGMLAFPGRSRCLICDADLGGAIPPMQESEQVSATEGTLEQEHQQVSVSERTFG